MIVSPAPRTSTELPDGYAPLSSPTSTLTLGVSRRSAGPQSIISNARAAGVRPTACASHTPWCRGPSARSPPRPARRRPPRRTGCRPRSGRRRGPPVPGTGGVPGRASTLIGAPTSATTRAMSSSLGQAGRVQHVGTGVAVGDEAGDRVVEVGDAVEEVLRPCREHEVGGRRSCRRHSFGRSLDRTDRVGAWVVVLDREAGRVGGVEQRDGLDHAVHVVGEAVLRVDVERHVDRRGRARSTWSINSSRRIC